MSHRVVVTGAGVVSAIGIGAERFWQACLDGASVVEPIPAHWSDYADYHSRVWSPLANVDLEAHGITRVERMQNDRVALHAQIAAEQAIAAAGLEIESRDRRARTFSVPALQSERTGVFMGTGIGGAASFLDNHAHQAMSRASDDLGAIEADPAAHAAIARIRARLHHPSRFNPFVVAMLMPNSVSAFVGLKLSLHGENETFAGACASGTVALGRAYRAVRSGAVDTALAGGSEYLDDHFGGIFQGFDVARTLVRDCDDPMRANRPFDRARSGFLFSQGGAAVVLLERLEAAEARGVEPLAEIAGFGETFDAHSMMAMAPGGEQVERMLHMTMADAGVAPGDVGYVNAHGTGTVANDEVESDVIGRVLGNEVRVNSTKSLLGHTIGASGALEAVATAFALRDQRAHVSRNLEDPIAPLAYLTRSEAIDTRVALTHSFAFGGHNACLAMRRVD